MKSTPKKYLPTLAPSPANRIQLGGSHPGNALVIVLLILVLLGLGAFWFFYSNRQQALADEKNQAESQAENPKPLQTRGTSSQVQEVEPSRAPAAEVPNPNKADESGTPKKQLGYSPFGAGSGSSSASRSVRNQAESERLSASNSLPEYVPAEGKQIPGIHLDYLKKSFELETRFQEQDMSALMNQSWRYVYEAPQSSYQLTFFGRSASDLYCVQAALMVADGEEMESIDLAAGRFFQVIAALGFEAGNAQQAATWAQQNTGKNTQASFGVLNMELIAEEPQQRVLRITAQ